MRSPPVRVNASRWSEVFVLMDVYLIFLRIFHYPTLADCVMWCGEGGNVTRQSKVNTKR